MDEIRVTVDQATVENFRRIETRTGRPMVSFRVVAGKEKLACVAFNRLAEQTDLQEGDQVFVAGRLQGNSWTTPEGDKRWGVQVVADRIELIDAAQVNDAYERMIQGDVKYRFVMDIASLQAPGAPDARV